MGQYDLPLKHSLMKTLYNNYYNTYAVTNNKQLQKNYMWYNEQQLLVVKIWWFILHRVITIWNC